MPRVDTLQRIVDATGATISITVEADHLPRQSTRDLEYPVLRDHTL